MRYTSTRTTRRPRFNRTDCGNWKLLRHKHGRRVCVGSDLGGMIGNGFPGDQFGLGAATGGTDQPVAGCYASLTMMTESVTIRRAPDERILPFAAPVDEIMQRLYIASGQKDALSYPALHMSALYSKARTGTGVTRVWSDYRNSTS